MLQFYGTPMSTILGVSPNWLSVATWRKITKLPSGSTNLATLRLKKLSLNQQQQHDTAQLRQKKVFFYMFNIFKRFPGEIFFIFEITLELISHYPILRSQFRSDSIVPKRNLTSLSPDCRCPCILVPSTSHPHYQPS